MRNQAKLNCNKEMCLKRKWNLEIDLIKSCYQPLSNEGNLIEFHELVL